MPSLESMLAQRGVEPESADVGGTRAVSNALLFDSFDSKLFRPRTNALSGESKLLVLGFYEHVHILANVQRRLKRCKLIKPCSTRVPIGRVSLLLPFGIWTRRTGGAR